MKLDMDDLDLLLFQYSRGFKEENCGFLQKLVSGRQNVEQRDMRCNVHGSRNPVACFLVHSLCVFLPSLVILYVVSFCGKWSFLDGDLCCPYWRNWIYAKETLHNGHPFIFQVWRF
jgi:hypothetical protein